MEREALIQVDSLSRRYGDVVVVDDVSFEVRRGEILGFLGPNGAGKSTTMRMVAGVLSATSGRIQIAGVDMQDAPMEAKRHIGFLPEDPPVYPDLTVDEYLGYCARLRDMPGREALAAIADSKARCGLEGVGGRLIGNLSKGYRQRVGIAQAIVHSPAVIILDEPSSGLDPVQIRGVRELMRELGRDHSIILSTHILSEVQSLCDRALIVNRGSLVLDQVIDRLRQDGPEFAGVELELLHPPALEELLGLDGVRSAVAVGEGVFRVEFNGNERGALDGVLGAIVENHWGLGRMNPLGDSLEEVFMRLVAGGQGEQPGGGE